LTGAKVNCTTGFLHGDYADGRRIAYITSLNDIKASKKTLQKIIKDWILLVD